MSWSPRTTRNGIEYGGSASSYYWSSVNPGATYSNCLANCTTFAYGRVLEEGCRAPVSSFIDAGNWHTVVTNGWRAETYSSYVSSVKPGDIIEWPGHVAVVEAVSGSTIYCSSSLYTGDHGRAYWPPGSSTYDTRSSSVMGSTLQDVSDWMIANYSWRFYEYVDSNTITNVRLSVQPTYILVNPDSGPGPGPQPGTETPTVTITPSSVNMHLTSSDDYGDITFNLDVSGIPAGETVSGGTSYPGLTRISNGSGWIYSTYTVDGVTYQRATKTGMVLRYDREFSTAYTALRNLTFSKTYVNGTAFQNVPINISVDTKSNIRKILAAFVRNRRKRGTINVGNI